MSRFIWNLINFVQAVYAASWSAFWIVAALAVRFLTGDSTASLAMARRIWAPGLLRGAFMRVEVAGLENIDLARPHFFTANHQSIVDIAVLFYVLPVPLLFILKEELRKVPFLGWYVSAMGMILLPRHERRRSLENLTQCRQRIAEGKCIITFPEGTRGHNGTIGPFKPSTFIPAIDAGVPIIPIAMDGPGRLLPPGGFRPRPGTIRVAIGQPIATAGLESSHRHELALKVRQQTVELWQGLTSPSSTKR